MDTSSSTECSSMDTTTDSPHGQQFAIGGEVTREMDAAECLQAAELMREEGNTKFRAKDFLGAEQDYLKALQLLEESKVGGSCKAGDAERARYKACRVPVLLNLALCYLKRQPCEAFRALVCCDEVLLLEPGHPKATYRRAKAFLELGELMEGQRDIVRACKLLPRDVTVRKDLEQVRHRLRELAKRRNQECQASRLIDELWKPKLSCVLNASLAARRLSFLLGSCELVQELEASGHAAAGAVDALAALAEQAIWMGIDYRTLGLGWKHPTTRSEYRCGQHPSTTHRSSRRRAGESRKRLVRALEEVVNGRRNVQAVIVEAFLREVGLVDARYAECGAAATYAAVCAALRAELLLPLRCFNEGEEFMLETHRGNPVPRDAIAECLKALMLAVVSHPDGFSRWRYTCPACVEQLRGLSSAQVALWRKPLHLDHGESVHTHEDGENELGLFWAGKIGGPSHGFDFEAQCCLPLLANARNKVIMTSVPWWPANPVSRAHFRLLWTAPGAPRFGDAAGCDVLEQAEPRLWLEAVNLDFIAEEEEAVDKRICVWATLHHAATKSEAMRAPLSVSTSMMQAMRAVAEDRQTGASVIKVREQLVLRPSNGVCEASDYLSSEHDWVQMSEEVTQHIQRALYVPASYCSVAGD